LHHNFTAHLSPPPPPLFPYTTLFRSTLEANRGVTAVEDLTDRARVTFADGSICEADLLIGADGLWSTVRKLIVDDEPHRDGFVRSEEHTSELQSRENLVCRLLLEKKN